MQAGLLQIEKIAINPQVRNALGLLLQIAFNYGALAGLLTKDPDLHAVVQKNPHYDLLKNLSMSIHDPLKFMVAMTNLKMHVEDITNTLNTRN